MSSATENLLSLPPTNVPFVLVKNNNNGGENAGGGASAAAPGALFVSGAGSRSASPTTTTTSGRHSPVATSAEGKFILQYLGAAMMDSRCTYTPQMMPWIIAEILRFSEPLQVVLLVSNGQVTCNSMQTRKPIFDSHILDCIRAFPVITSDGGGESSSATPTPTPALESWDFDILDERKYFATIIKANDIYLHCRLFSASCDAQVSEVMSTMKESTRVAVNSPAGPVVGTLRSASTPKVSDLSDIPQDAITFEVLYTGKLRMSSRKAPPTFIDDALDKFRSHENEKGRRESVAISYSRRSSSQESTSDLGGSSDSLSLQSHSAAIAAVAAKYNSANPPAGEDLTDLSSSSLSTSSCVASASTSTSTGGAKNHLKNNTNTLITVLETSDNPNNEIDEVSSSSLSYCELPSTSASTEQAFPPRVSSSSPSPPSPSIVRRHQHQQHERSPLKACHKHPLEDVMMMTGGKSTGTGAAADSSSILVKSMSLPVEPAMRGRAFSTGHSPAHGHGHGQHNELEATRNDPSQYNRTMILIVGRHELRIISPDAKTSLFTKHFRDIYHSSQGIENKEYFGFICRENPVPSSSSGGSGSGGGGNSSSKQTSVGYVAYVFRCESDCVAGDILKVLKQAYLVNHENLKKERQIQSCDHCPMVWYRQLCNDIDGIPCDDKIQTCILRNINGLPEEDRQNILAKFHGAEPQTVQEQNELLMMLLRAHCESKQAKHIHDTAENRHEFLSQYLGGGAILMKAKRSITNSFDHLIKRKGREGPTRENSLPHYSTPVREICGNPGGVGGAGRVVVVGPDSNGSSGSPVRKSPGEGSVSSASGSGNEDGWIVSDSPLENIQRRPRSSTVGALTGEKIRCEIRNRRTSQGIAVSPLTKSPSLRGNEGNPPSPRNMGSKEQRQHSPMMNIFLKVGSQNKPTPESSGKGIRRSGSWRHAIFKRVVSPSTPESGRGTPQSYTPSTPVSSRSGHYRPKRTRQEIRELWKSAINQQIILIRMEKQNLRLKAKQQEADVKRLKLSYLELGTCDEEANDTWDLIMTQAQANPSQRCDIQLLNSAILRGIPKHKRGQIWQFFIQQRKLGGESQSNASGYSHINLDIPYEQLLRQLTSQQHAILIDLGRTFPSHSYFSSPLGSGQLALFNILKAYSLLDTDVGYCQGLSFVAGLLLMHYEEDDAFAVLKYLMFSLGAREHYKPDMLGLQVKLYQLTRLIHDQDPDIQLLLYHNDVLPSLYAAPWFLTMFASQFPVGFAVRVLDLVLLHGVDVIAKFALALVLDHKKELMECNGLEQVMDCFKTVVTQITSEKLDRYLRKVIESELDKQMLTYAVEYSVMNDEAFSAFLGDSSHAPQQHLPIKLNKSISTVNKQVQTESDSRESSPSGESHPILGELIQRQNLENQRLKQEKAELRRDIQTLLSCVLTMQKLAKISSKGSICPPVPPQVTDIATKYVIGGATYFSSVMENGWSSTITEEAEDKTSGSQSRNSVEIEDYEEDDDDNENMETTTTTSSSSTSRFFSQRMSSKRLMTMTTSNLRGDDTSSQAIPPLDDQDSDDNSSDHSSHQLSFDPMPSSSSSKIVGQSSISLSSPSHPHPLDGEGNGSRNNGLGGNKISTILM